MQLGPYEINSVYQGDCALLMRKLPDECIDLVVTSPPYDDLREYNGYTFYFEAIAAELWRVIKPGGVVVWVVADQTVDGSETGTSFRQALHFMELGFNLHDTMIYEVAGTGAKGSNYAYWQAFEYMFVFSKGRPATVNRLKDRRNKWAGATHSRSPKMERMGVRTEQKQRRTTPEYSIRTNVWQYVVGNANGDDITTHPAPFPLALARDHILTWTEPGDIALDPMCGSGTTLKAAWETGRRFLGFDISANYCDIARRRVQYAKTPLPFAQEPA